MAANAVAALEHENCFGVELGEVELRAIETDRPEVVAYLTQVREVHRSDSRVHRKQTWHVLEFYRHVLVEERDEALDRGDSHERHVCCAEHVQITLTAAREQLVHADHEMNARAPRGLFPVCVEDAETTSEYDTRDVLHAGVSARVEGGEVEAVVFEIGETAVDDFGDNVLFRVLEDNIADTVANIDATAHIEDVLRVEDELLPRAYFEEGVLRARADVREYVPVEIRLCGCVVVYGENELLDGRCE
jgi:hypothetical protein